jgi:surface protein
MFNSEISAWNTSSVQNFSLALFGASSFNVDISRWDLRSATNMTKMVRYMFQCSTVTSSCAATSLTISLVCNFKLAGATVFNQNLCLWAQSLAITSDVATTSMFLSTGCPNTADPVLINGTGSSFCYGCDAPSNSPSIRHDTETLAPTAAGESLHDSPANIFSNGSASREKFLVFADGDELRIAVDKYLLDSSPTSNVAAIYGYPIGTWNVSLVADFGFVFDANRNSMTATFGDDLSGWDTSSAETMERMFAGATSFRGDISTWSTGLVRTMQGMCKFLQSSIVMKPSFFAYRSITPTHAVAGADLFDGDLSSWDTSMVVDAGSMFQSALSFTGKGLMHWNTSSITNMQAMFSEAGSFNSDISAWEVSNVVSMASMFAFANKFNSNLHLWNVANVESFSYAFNGASSFNRDLSSWDVRRGITFAGMVRLERFARLKHCTDNHTYLSLDPTSLLVLKPSIRTCAPGDPCLIHRLN